MWFLPVIVLSIAIRLNGATRHQINEDNIPRFVIPHPEEKQRSAFLPEAISVVKKSGSIVGTELPGAYGEDFEIENGFESGSGASASGSGGDKADVIFVARSGEDLETAGKYGNNNLASVPPSNPATAFTDDSKEGDDDAESEKDQSASPLKKEKNVKVENIKNSVTSKEPVAKVETKKAEEVEKPAKVEKVEKPDKQKSTKKRTKAKAKILPNPEENNMISKIDAIARQIERVEHKEKLDRKEEATLKVAKKVAKKVIKDIAAKKEKAKIEKQVSNIIEKEAGKTIGIAPSEKKENAPAEEPKDSEKDDQGESPGDEASELRERALYIQNLKKSEEKSKNQKLVEEITKPPEVKQEVEKSSERKQETPAEQLQNSTEKSTVVGADEESECPWGCFWKCQSYCPTKCCNNPYKCQLSCREFCAPYCPSKCCAPGSKRLPKLKISFLTDANINSSNSAENSYQQEKEQSEKINLVNQIDALKKTSTYAAQLMGLPSQCPLACARICLPGLCHHECCGKAHAIGPPLSCPISCSHACYPGLCTGRCCTRPPPSANGPPDIPTHSTADSSVMKMTFLLPNKAHTPRPVIWNANPYIRTINEQLLEEKLRKGKMMLPGPDQYKALMLINQLSKSQLKALLKKTVT